MPSPSRSTEVATGMRQTLEETTIPLPISRSVRTETLKKILMLPPSYIGKEPPRTRERAADFWERHCLKSVAELIRTRKSRSMHKDMRRVVFRSGMEKLATQFNRSTENLKVEFVEQKSSDRNSKNTNTSYAIKFCRLTPIPESVRNAPSCSAEIVRMEQERIAQAELVGLAEGEDNVMDANITEILDERGGIQPAPRPRQPVVCATTEILATSAPLMPVAPVAAQDAAITSEAIAVVAMSSEPDSQPLSAATSPSTSERSWQQHPEVTVTPDYFSNQEQDVCEAPAVAAAVVCEVMDSER